jgi:hypothetical protein
MKQSTVSRSVTEEAECRARFDAGHHEASVVLKSLIIDIGDLQSHVYCILSILVCMCVDTLL